MSDGSAGQAIAQPQAFVGREPDFARLVAAYEVAAAGAPGVVLVAGEAGIGKSRLVSELATAVEDAGGRVMIGACLDLADGGLPLLPLAEALRGLARTTSWPELEGTLGPLRPQLARLVPALGEDGSETDEPLAAARMEEGVLAILGRLAADRPALLVFEDVHWIDRASRDLVTFLARNLSTEPMLIALTCRTEDLQTDTERWLAELGRQPRVDRMDLGRLDRESVRAQMAAITGSEPDARLVERTWRRSEGNPYFVEELATAGDDHAPVTLTASLTARLAVLSPPTREIVRIVALGGRSIDEDLLVAAADRPVADVRDALHEAVERRVLAIGDDGRIGFRHALVREVAESELLAGERRDLHERLASVLAEHVELAEPSPAGAAAELAYHWEGAGHTGEALTAAIEAGAAAARVAAWADADRQYERALRLADRAALPEGVDRIELLRRAAEAAEFSGDLPRAQALVDRALAEPDGGGERVALLHARHGYLRWTQGDNDGSLAAYERGLALLPEDPPTAARARILGSLAGALLGLGRYEDGRRSATDGVATAEAAVARPEEARARNVLGSILVALGEVAPGIEHLERSAELAAEAGPSDMRVIGPYNLAVNLAMAGRLREAQDAAARGVEAARTEGLQRRYGMDLAALEGDVLTRLGRWDEAAEVMDAGLALDPVRGGTIYLATARGRLEALRGDVATARRWFATADDHFVRSPLLVLAIQAAAEVAEAARAAHDDATVAETVAPYVTELESLTASAPMVAALRAHALAEASRLDGRSSPERWTDAAAAFAEIPDPFGVAYARYRCAEAVLRRDGVKADVGDLLRDAADEAASIGALPLYRSIETLARRARVPMDRPEALPSEPGRRKAGGLSPREIEVLRLVADGRSNGEIGEALFISRKTAGVHVTHILDKLGVANRVEAAMAASRLGLLDDADGS